MLWSRLLKNEDGEAIMRRERGLRKLYADDPVRADMVVFGRRGVL